MTRKTDRSTTRVQVYFENPKVETALRREARVARIALSRAAERAIERGLVKRPTADPEDRLLNLERSLRDHMRATARDMSIVQELFVELARIIFLRLPEMPADHDPLMQASAAARIERMLDAAAARIVAGGSVRPAAAACGRSDEAGAATNGPSGGFRTNGSGINGSGINDFGNNDSGNNGFGTSLRSLAAP